jgi:hypothetical protein
VAYRRLSGGIVECQVDRIPLSSRKPSAAKLTKTRQDALATLGFCGILS